MTKLLDEDDGDEAEEIDALDLVHVLEGLADADAGRFANEKEIEAAFQRFGPMKIVLLNRDWR